MSRLHLIPDARLPRPRQPQPGDGDNRAATVRAPRGVGRDVNESTRRTRALAPTPCGREDPELWFSESPAQLERAKELCGHCPRRAACLAGALERQEPWGVWGGEIFQDGVIIARKRPRGRPRKDQDAA
jgi:WhiB family transcriptional regulator, redox-sensing transcriptional regulator